MVTLYLARKAQGRLLLLLRHVWPVLVLIGTLFTFTADIQGQSFTSGSTESDNALDFSNQPPGTVVIFDPRTMSPPRDVDGDNVYHFTTITIPTGVTVRLLGSQLNMRPVFWLASGAVQINETIDLSGENGHPITANPAVRRPSSPGAGGYPGGIGSFGSSLPQDGSGPGGGKKAITSDGGGGHAGYATTGCCLAGPVYGNAFLVPLLGGSGGGGGRPHGTVVKLHIFSENGADQIIDSAPLAGTTDATSTTTASVVIPPGFSRGFVRATWTAP